MTQHALQRIAERFPAEDPETVLLEINAAYKRNALTVAAMTITGTIVCEMYLASRQVIFPVFATDASVVTVLTEGMVVETATGKQALSRRFVGLGVCQMDPTRYHADPCEKPSLSSTLAKIISSQSPLHAWTASQRLNPNWKPVEKKVFDFGRAAHRRVLGRGDPYIAIPPQLLAANGATSTKAAKEFVKAARELGQVPLKQEEVDRIDAMQAKLAQRLKECEITLDPAHSEMAAFAWVEGTMCRMMADNAPPHPRAPLYDFKTTTDAEPEACMRAIMNYGYDLQASHYRQTWREATGQNRPFRFIFQEKTPPFEVCIVELGDDSAAMGDKKIASARYRWQECLDRGEWPGYEPGVHRMELPEWFHAKALERESRQQDHRERASKEAIERANRFQAPGLFEDE